MNTPHIAQRNPIDIDVTEGKTYYWCACGLSKNQPFCDGSHKTTSFAPVEYRADKTAKVWFCACKHSNKKPICDGTHSKV